VVEILTIGAIQVRFLSFPLMRITEVAAGIAAVMVDKMDKMGRITAVTGNGNAVIPRECVERAKMSRL